MYKVKILLFLCGMEELTAGLNALRQWQLHKGGGNEWKGEGCVGKGRGGKCVEWKGRVERAGLCGERQGQCAELSW